jgi:hypothetical protein
MYCFSAASDWCSRFLLPQVIGLWRVLLPQVIESYCRKWLNLTAASDGLPVNSHEVDRMLGHLRVMRGRHIMKNYCASHIDGFLTLYQRRRNVTKCHACHTKPRYTPYQTSKRAPIADGTARAFIVKLRPGATGCEHKSNLPRTHLHPHTAKIKREPFITHSVATKL